MQGGWGLDSRGVVVGTVGLTGNSAEEDLMGWHITESGAVEEVGMRLAFGVVVVFLRWGHGLGAGLVRRHGSGIQFWTHGVQSDSETAKWGCHIGGR